MRSYFYPSIQPSVRPTARPSDNLRNCLCDDVRLHIAAAPSKHCALDPGPTWLIKKCGDVLAPFITDIFNGSITTGHFSIAWKTGHVLRSLDWTRDCRKITVQFRICRFYRDFRADCSQASYAIFVGVELVSTFPVCLQIASLHRSGRSKSVF